MALLDWLLNLDKQLFLTINSAHSPFFDQVMVVFTSKQIWVLFYLSILWVGFRKFNNRFWWVVISIILLIVIADQSSFWLKQTIQRYRPGHEPELVGKVHLPIGPRGMYGFFSSHAANAFGVAVFTLLLFKNKGYTWLMLFWSLMVSYTRAYLGLHYPLDLLIGAIWGSFLGWGIHKTLMLFDTRRLRKRIMRAGTFKSVEMKPVWNSFFITIVIVLVTISILQ